MQPLPPPGALCATHAAAPATGACARCGTFICLECAGPEGAFCPKCRELGATTREPPPWERRAQLGLVKAIIEQWKLSVFSPEKFWRGLPPEGSTIEPLLYAWLLLVLQAGPAFLVQAANFGQLKASLALVGQELPGWVLDQSPWTWAAWITFPLLVMYPVSFFLGAGLTHLGCKLWGAGDKGFAATARVMGYAQAPILFGWVPVVGLVAVVWLIVLQVLGIARVHGTTPGKATLGVLTLPLVLTCCLMGGAVLLVAAMIGSTR